MKKKREIILMDEFNVPTKEGFMIGFLENLMKGQKRYFY